MPIFQELVSFDELYQNLDEKPESLNTLTAGTEDEREAIREMVMTRYSGDMISMLPSCRCGESKGDFPSTYRCANCGGPVVSSIESDVHSAIWFMQPDGVAPLVNPSVWILLEDRMRKSGFSILRWLTDLTYAPPVKRPDDILEKFEQAGIPRGYNNFVANFDEIMKFVFSLKKLTKKGGPDYLQEVLTMYRHCVFSRGIPLPNKTLFIVEQTNMGIYLDAATRDAFDMILMMVSIDKNFQEHGPAGRDTRVKENRTAKILARYAEYQDQSYRVNMAGKPGQFRRHIYGSRTIFSFRAVISSTTEFHDYEGLDVPWGVGITAFRPHLINKLMRYGFDLNAAVSLLKSHVNKYHKLLDRFLKELIAEAPDGRISLTCQRNPSLLQGSIQRMYIRQFKTDAADRTVGLSVLCVRAPNA